MIPFPSRADQLRRRGLSTEHDAQLTQKFDAIAALYEKPDYEAAAAAAVEYEKFVRELLGTSHIEYATAAGMQARIDLVRGKYDAAAERVRKSITVRERARPSRQADHEDLAGDLDTLAQVCQLQGKLGDSEAAYRRALSAHEKAGDQARLGTAITLNNLAWLYQAQGRYQEAEPLAKRAIAMIDKSRGSTRRDYGSAVDTLAKIFEGQGRIKEAEKNYRKAIAVLKEELPDNAEDIASVRDNLGGLLKSAGRLREAEDLLTKALAAKREALGPDHPSLATTLVLLADLNQRRGKPETAEKLFTEALALQRSSLREVSLFFATDRKRGDETDIPSFGGERSDTVTLGTASVMVSAPPKEPQTTAVRNSDKRRWSSELIIGTTEVGRLTMRSVTIEPDASRLQTAARQRVASASAYPKQAFVFVHGYNTTFEGAVRRTAQLVYDLNFDGAAFVFSWPSRSNLWSYAYDRESANLAVNHFRDFLKEVVARTGAEEVHLIAHSMGNVVLLDALEKLKLSKAELKPFGEIVLHAPDIDSDRFRQAMSSLRGVGNHFTLYASSNDKALSVSGFVWGLVGRAGGAPSLVDGVETIDVTAVGTSLLGLNHDLYATNAVVFGDMRSMLSSSRHPPNERSPRFAVRETDVGIYWLYEPETARASSRLGPPTKQP